jgi:hypothetical protein
MEHTETLDSLFSYSTMFIIMVLLLWCFQDCCKCPWYHVPKGGPDCNRHAYDMQCGHRVFGNHPWWLRCCVDSRQFCTSGDWHSHEGLKCKGNFYSG